MSPIVVTTGDTRRLFLQRQGLCNPPRQKLSRKALLALVEELGFVQIDSINTLERAHHLILFSRNQTYRREDLQHLLERDAALFENWTHDAAIIPTAFFPYWRPRFAKEEERLRNRWRKWRRDRFEQEIDKVLDHVRANGPVLARQLGEENSKKTNGGWWDWHPSKTALEYLWRTGALAVARREGFQKVYDLTERVIPPTSLKTDIAHEDFVDWACAAALDRLGIATHGELAAYWGGVAPDEARAWCRKRLGKELVEVSIEDANGGRPRRAYARADLPDRLAELDSPPPRLRVLSPFDPLIRDRNRTQRLFDFHYRIEVFVPQAKRQYGYYVFPLLEGDRLIGRIDMKHLRQENRVSVNGLWMEPKVRLTGGRRQALDAELERLRRFVGAQRVDFEQGYLKTDA